MRYIDEELNKVTYNWRSLSVQWEGRIPSLKKENLSI